MLKARLNIHVMKNLILLMRWLNLFLFGNSQSFETTVISKHIESSIGKNGKRRQIEGKHFTLLTSYPAFSSNIFMWHFVILQNENKLQSSEISYKIKILVATLLYYFLISEC